MKQSPEMPLYSRVTEDGFHIGWIDGPQGSLDQKRLDIYVELPESRYDSIIKVYAIRVGPGEISEIHHIFDQSDLSKVMQNYFEVKL